jgi:hypothetical protein
MHALGQLLQNASCGRLTTLAAHATATVVAGVGGVGVFLAVRLDPSRAETGPVRRRWFLFHFDEHFFSVRRL